MITTPFLFLASSLQEGVFLPSHLPREEAYVYFSPEDHLEQKIIDIIEKEDSFIWVCVYMFTHGEIAEALIRAWKRGVPVEIIADRVSGFSITKPTSAIKKIIDNEIPIFIWSGKKNKKNRKPLMHNKFCVFGSGKVWTGSFNFTYDASTIHQENAIVLSEKGVFDIYKRQFQNIKAASCLLCYSKKLELD